MYLTEDGQTGSGKTHSMVSRLTSSPMVIAAFILHFRSSRLWLQMGTPDSPGLIPRIASNLFNSIAHLTTLEDTCTVHISYFEIYNEQVRDLLSATPQQFTDAKTPTPGGLRVRERTDGSVFIEGLNEFQCKGFEDVLAFMKMGNKVRPAFSTLRFSVMLYYWWKLMLGRSARRLRH